MSQYKRTISYIKNPYKVVYSLGSRMMLKWIPDSIYLKLIYRARMGQKLNLQKPETFNEKIQWLKLYDRQPLYTELVDKYEVRKHISKIIGEEYLIPLIGVWDRFEDIDFSKLPNQFVLKCTHDSGGLVICTDKTKLDINLAKKKINKSLNRNYYYPGREWPYKDVKPRIICEKYMVDESGLELKDYKLMCFNGEVKCLFVCLNRNSVNGLNVDFYDMDWTPMPFEKHFPKSNTIIPEPKNFSKMVEIAEILAKQIPFVRVDLYEVKGRIYFGELTFHPGGGFEKFNPEKYDYVQGSWIKLPIKKKKS